jgi:hypothetical protein
MTSYNYASNIRPPSALGMSPDGTLKALGNDINGLISYTQLLVEGSGKASATGKPMGNKYFLKTPGTCEAIDTKEVVDRYIFINNIPMGNIPFISDSIGGNFSTFKGLIPGMLSDMDVFNPKMIIKGFMAGSMPQCRPITLQTIDTNNNVGSETHYIADVDIDFMDPCLFPNKKNPVTNKGCTEVFSNINEQDTYHENKIVIIFILIFIYFFLLFTIT